MVSAEACEIRRCFETRCRYFAKRLLADTRILSLSPFSFRNKGNEGERSFPPRRSAAVVIFHRRGGKKFQCTAELGEFGRVTAPRLSHMFQSFKLNRAMNRCLREAFCSPAGYVTACALLFSSYWHFKIRRSGAGPLLFFFFSSFFLKKKTQITAMDTFCFATGENTLLRLFDRKIGESAPAISFRKILLPFSELSGPPG